MKGALLGIWLGLAAVAAAAGGDDPAARAVAYLVALQAGEQEVGEILQETLLSPHCSQGKREVIRARLGRLGGRLRAGSHELEAIAERRDAEYAAVLVSAVGRRNPYDVEVVSIGLRKEDGAWRVAPVPGSFENANVAYARDVERRVDALEEWMGRERILRLRGLQKSALKVLEDRMEKAASGELLQNGPPVAVAEGFLKACEARDLAATLVYCREGMDEEDLDKLIGEVDRGLRWTGRGQGWHELTSPDMVRVVVPQEEAEERSAVVSVLCYDPGTTAGPKVLPIELMKIGARWQVALPRSLREAGQGGRTGGWRRNRLAEELGEKFPEHFERARPARRFATMEEAARETAAILLSGTLDEFFCAAYRGGEMTATEKRISYAQMARLWKAFRKQEAGFLPGTLVSTVTEGTAGMAVLRLPVTGRLDRMDLEPVLFLNRVEGWAIAPGVMDQGNCEALPEEDLENQRRILARFMKDQELFAKKAAAVQLKHLDLLRVGGGDPLAGEEAAGVVRAFRRELREGKLREAFARCGLLDRAEGALEGLQALAHESRGARRSTEADQELLVDTRGAWAGVSLRVDSGPADEPDYPLYLVVRSENGPRIAVDAGLRLPTNPGRGILNGEVWEHLEATLEKREVGLVRALFEGHRQRTLKDFEEWEKSTKSSR